MNIILYFTILYYTILYYTILYYTILYYTILNYTILCFTILYYITLHYIILYYIILYYIILYYIILYYIISYYIILYYRYYIHINKTITTDKTKYLNVLWQTFEPCQISTVYVSCEKGSKICYSTSQQIFTGTKLSSYAAISLAFGESHILSLQSFLLSIWLLNAV